MQCHDLPSTSHHLWVFRKAFEGMRVLLMGETLWAEIFPYSKAAVSMKAALRRQFGEIGFTRGSVDR
jgi:hypothetical protein